ncbi:hypothetical protein [Streptomyces sp. NPDC005970]|uniref:hypothetical protein n=1 Tax=Streptomyces sp. NPDC005970 TaxID=3156723 RepID=UPI0034056F8F
MKTYAYVMRLAEQTAVTALAAFLTAWGASGYDLSRGALGAAVGAALRALYGVLARPVGDRTQPSIK